MRLLLAAHAAAAARAATAATAATAGGILAQLRDLLLLLLRLLANLLKLRAHLHALIRERRVARGLQARQLLLVPLTHLGALGLKAQLACLGDLTFRSLEGLFQTLELVYQLLTRLVRLLLGRGERRRVRLTQRRLLLVRCLL